MHKPPSIPDPPIVTRLDGEIDAGSDPRLRAVALARRGAYLARTGQSAEALVLAQYLRSENRSTSDPELFCWIWILEAIASCYGTKSPAEHSLLVRAYEVSRSMGLLEVKQIAAAWLAHVCFDENKYPEMVKWLHEAWSPGAQSAEAACRASIVLAAATEMAGCRTESLKWFGKARLLAQQTGDRAAIVALATNRAAMRLDRFWVEWVFSRNHSDDIIDIERELDGGVAFEEATRYSTMASQVSIWRMRLHILKGNYIEAMEVSLETDERNIEKLPVLKSKPAIAAWLFHINGSRTQAVEYYHSALDEPFESFDVDDRATSLKLLSEISSTLIRDGRGDELEKRANLAIQKYDSDRNLLATYLLTFGGV
jgi:hypothetical protein